jgi:hypothetical protein
MCVFVSPAHTNSVVIRHANTSAIEWWQSPPTHTVHTRTAACASLITSAYYYYSVCARQSRGPGTTIARSPSRVHTKLRYKPTIPEHISTVQCLLNSCAGGRLAGPGWASIVLLWGVVIEANKCVGMTVCVCLCDTVLFGCKHWRVCWGSRDTLRCARGW